MKEVKEPARINLDAFCNLYAVAGNRNCTDYFSTKEIQVMLTDNGDESYSTEEIKNELLQLGYMQTNDHGKLVWMVRDKKDNERTVLLLENGTV